LGPLGCCFAVAPRRSCYLPWCSKARLWSPVKHDFAKTAPRSDFLQRRGGLRKRVARRNHRSNPALLIQIEESLKSPVNQGWFVLAVGAPMPAHDGDVFQQNPVGLNRRDASGRETHDQQPPPEGNAFGGQIENISADGVVNNVGAAAFSQFHDSLVPTRLAIVNGVASPMFAGYLELPRRAGSREYARAQRASDLDGGKADPACGCMNQQGLARLKTGPVNQAEIRGLIDDRKCGGVVEGH